MEYENRLASEIKTQIIVKSLSQGQLISYFAKTIDALALIGMTKWSREVVRKHLEWLKKELENA